MIAGQPHPAVVIERSRPKRLLRGQGGTGLPGVNLFAHVNGAFGLATAGRGTAAALRAGGIPHLVTDLDNSHPLVRPDTPFSINVIHTNPDILLNASNWRQGRLDRTLFVERYTIGCWAWESLSTFPAEWVRVFPLFDEIWVPSQFVARSLTAISPVPVVVVPHAVEPARPTIGRQALDLPGAPFLFAFLFDEASGFNRKNAIGLIRAFQLAFPDGDGSVALVIKARTLSPGNRQRLEAEARGSRSILLRVGETTAEETLGLIAACDAYVSLHRSEGFGLTMAEAMSMGKPVIATDYSGFLPDLPGACLPVRSRPVTLTEADGYYPAGTVWAEPDIEHAALLMRELVETPDMARRYGAAGAAAVQAHLSPAAIGRRLVGRLSTIAASLEPARQDGGSNVGACGTPDRPEPEPQESDRMPSLSDLQPQIARSGALFCTVVTRSHLHHAWRLRQEVRRHHPDFPFCILVLDAPEGDSMQEEVFFDCPLIRLDAFMTPEIADMAIYYTAYELCGNIKPYFLLHLFQATSARKIIYLDSDLFLTGPLWAAVGKLDSHDLTCAPHTLSPLPEDGSEPSDLTIAANGPYNTGFMGFARTDAVLDMLSWMAKRVHRRGFDAFAQGMFCEQRYFNLGVTFLKDRFGPLFLEGYNVGYWNLHERALECRDGVYFANGTRVAFFHMSGFNFDDLSRFSKYEQRYTLSSHPQSAILHRLIADLRQRYDEVPFAPQPGYRFDRHEGLLLTPELRRHYHATGRFEGDMPLATAIMLGQQCIKGGQHDRAIKIFATILRSLPGNIEALYGYGLACRHAGHNDRASDAFHRILDLNPAHAGAKAELSGH